MGVAEKEARLLKALATELQELELMESFKLTGSDAPAGYTGFTLFNDVAVCFKTPLAYNDVATRERMSQAIALLVAEGARELVDTAVARQRQVVEQARQDLRAFQAKPQDTALDEKALDVDDRPAPPPPVQVAEEVF
jgi:hypothetical protein